MADAFLTKLDAIRSRLEACKNAIARFQDQWITDMERGYCDVYTPTREYSVTHVKWNLIKFHFLEATILAGEARNLFTGFPDGDSKAEMRWLVNDVLALVNEHHEMADLPDLVPEVIKSLGFISRVLEAAPDSIESRRYLAKLKWERTLPPNLSLSSNEYKRLLAIFIETWNKENNDNATAADFRRAKTRSAKRPKDAFPRRKLKKNQPKK